MDAYSTKKRAADGILGQALNHPARVQQRSLSEANVAALRQEKAEAKALKLQLVQDQAVQKSQLKSMQAAVKQSKDHGGPRYRHAAPTEGEERPPEYEKGLQKMSKTGADIASAKKQIDKLDRELKREAQADAPQMGSLADWFSKYGDPKRKSNTEENQVSFNMKPRRTAFGGHSSATTLRLGKGIWNDSSALRARSRPPIGLNLA
eukprot:TRINITY_DN31438_c0_g2_i1.p1 TRINITY_DN31438_c0_g2~~TRINITY_DN31438_c0_g2_i1.p1  ORF type:complete len:206 (-),score=48.77 TRINITY_DN31438_c0_g2_i1:204-821(-)